MQYTSKDLLAKKTPPIKKGDYLYFIQAKNTGLIKIGRTKNPDTRFRNLQTGNGEELRMIACFEGWGWREPSIHELLKRWRLQGEWFSVECVGSIPEDIYENIPIGAFDTWWCE
jgi:hypothetical protein